MDAPHDRFLCSDGIERSLYDIYMDGTSVFSFSISDVPKALEDYLNYTETTSDDYDIFAFHQANEFIIKQLIRKLKLKKESVPISLDRYGNTGGISIPITLCDAFGSIPDSSQETENGNTVKRILMSGFGIGLSWGVTSVSIDMRDVFPIEETDDYYREGRITPDML